MNNPTVTLPTSALLALALAFAGCGDSGSQAETEKVKQEAHDAYESAKSETEKLADATKESAEKVGHTIEQGYESAKAETEKLAQDAASKLSGSTQSAASADAVLSGARQQLTKQLGDAASGQLVTALETLKAKAAEQVVKSSIDSLGSSLASGNVDQSLGSLAALSQFGSEGKLGSDPLALKDVVSLSSASILDSAFGGDSSSTPSLIDSAIGSFKSTDLLGGATDLVKSLGSNQLSGEQTDIVDQLVNAALPVLGEHGETLKQLYEQGSQLKGAADAVKNLF